MQWIAAGIWLAIALCLVRYWTLIWSDYGAADAWANAGWVLFWPGLIALAFAAQPA